MYLLNVCIKFHINEAVQRSGKEEATNILWSLK
jgi:hypothetical protein